MKIMFLDFDGVLNNQQWAIKCWEEADKTGDASIIYTFDPKNIEVLNKIFSKVKDLNIVVSSTWRLGKNIQQLRIILADDGFEYPHRVIDKTPKLWNEKRGAEIQKWLDSNKYTNITHWVIIDDDSDMLHLKTGLVQIDNDKGLTEEYIPSIMSLLGEDNE